jgi:tetratricopeptide (TPR) repeat protein
MLFNTRNINIIFVILFLNTSLMCSCSSERILIKNEIVYIRMDTNDKIKDNKIFMEFKKKLISNNLILEFKLINNKIIDKEESNVYKEVKTYKVNDPPYEEKIYGEEFAQKVTSFNDLKVSKPISYKNIFLNLKQNDISGVSLYIKTDQNGVAQQDLGYLKTQLNMNLDVFITASANVDGIAARKSLVITADELQEAFKFPKPIITVTCNIEDSNKNGIIEIGESAKLIININNEGSEVAEEVKLQVSGFEDTGISLGKWKKIGDIQPHKNKVIVVPIISSQNMKDREILLTIKTIEKNNNNPEPLKKTVKFQKNIEKIEQLAKAEAPEELFYKRVVNDKTIEICKQYLSEFQTGKHKSNVIVLLEDLKWKKASEDNSIEAYKKYLTEYPSGKYVKGAQKQIQGIKESKALEEAKKLDTYQAYQRFINDFPDSLQKNEIAEKTKLKYWQEKLGNEPNNSHVLCQVAGLLLLQKGDLAKDDAIEYYNKAIENNKKCAPAYIAIGRMLLEEKRFSEAGNILDKAIRNGCTNCEIFYYCGRLCQAQNNLSAAIDYYSRAINAKTDFVECLFLRGLIYRTMLNYEDARHDFNKVIQIAPNSRWAHTAREHLNKM